MRPSQQLELKVGLLVVSGIVATIVMIMLSDKLSFEHYYRINAFLDDAGGLRMGSPVTLSGITIGNVVDIEQSDDPRGAIRVVARIRDHEHIPRNAALELASSGIFGDSFLAFTKHGPSDGWLSTDGTAAVIASPGFLVQASEQAKTILHNVSGLLDEATARDMKRLVKNAADLAGDGAQVAHTLAGERQQLGEILQNLQEVSTTLRSVASRGDSITGHLDHTLAVVDARVRILGDRAEATVDRVDALLASVQDAIDQNRRALGQTLGELAQAAGSAAQVLHAVAAGQGVLGRLVTSRDLAADVDRIAVNLTVMAQLLATHPSDVVWGESRATRAAAERQRDQLLMQHRLDQDFGGAGTAAAPAPAGTAPPARSPTP